MAQKSALSIMGIPGTTRSFSAKIAAVEAVIPVKAVIVLEINRKTAIVLEINRKESIILEI